MGDVGIVFYGEGGKAWKILSQKRKICGTIAKKRKYGTIDVYEKREVVVKMLQDLWFIKIWMRAEKLEKDGSKNISAECFLLATIDELLTGENLTPESKQVEFLLKTNFGNLEKARFFFAQKMAELPKEKYMESKRYMQQIMEDIEEYFFDRGLWLEQRLTVTDVVSKMLETPWENISVLQKLHRVNKAFETDFPGKRAAKGEAEESPINSEEAMGQMLQHLQKTNEMRDTLNSIVRGQANAVNQFVTGYFQARVQEMLGANKKRPRATFLFAGPPGVGKTFLAENIAKLLTLPYLRVDMSEYADKESLVEFCGSDKVYTNGKAGNVTGYVQENPECVLLFDEVEKAHIKAIHLFLQMLDSGRLRDNYTDKEVDFSKTIIIMTTNAGRGLYEDSEKTDFSDVSRKVIINAIRRDVNPETKMPFFPEALCSRFAMGNVVMFNHMTAGNLWHIARDEVAKSTQAYAEKTGIAVTVDDAVYTSLLYSEGANVDARTISGRARSLFNEELYELFRLVNSDACPSTVKDLKKIHMTADLVNLNPDVAPLFSEVRQYRCLLFAGDDILKQCAGFLGEECLFFDAKSKDDAVEILRNQEIDFALIDPSFGYVSLGDQPLNVEDLESVAREVYQYLRRGDDVPVYILEKAEGTVNREEQVSFLRSGAQGLITLDASGEGFREAILDAGRFVQRNHNMLNLARSNKLVSYGTAQRVTESGEEATICLYDYKMDVAIDAEDSKSFVSAVSTPNVKFDQVIGAKDAKDELAHFVKYLKNPKQYMGSGLKPPKGVILYGPPGTGKTMLAKAMASESGVSFIAAEGNQFLKKYVGEGGEEVHRLFRIARKYAPAVLFVDEIDAIAKERTGDDQRGTEAILTAFLTEMDGFSADTKKPVFVLAATNFDVTPGSAKSLDPALMRRFDRRVYIGLPDKEDRQKFLEMKVKENEALAISEVQIENTVLRSTGMSLANLDSVVELALRYAVRAGETCVTDEIFEEAFETFNNGESRENSGAQLERVARHEAGHALICGLSGEMPSYLTVVSRGDHGGYMQHENQEDKMIYTKEELLAKIRTSLGGRAAEMVYYGDREGISTGASGDLASATNLARHLICTYGMDDELGLAVISPQAAELGELAGEVRKAVNRILREEMDNAIRMIAENREKMDALVAELVKKNSLIQSEIEAIILA